MKKKIDWEEFSTKAAEHIRQGKPLTGEGGIFTPLLKQVIEAAMEGEMDAHLENTRTSEKNRRNGKGRKTLKSSLGTFEISPPRDRTGSFEPQVVEKRQVSLSSDLDAKIIGLYGLGMSYSDIHAHFKEMYGVEVGDATISSITDRVIPELRAWQERPLQRLYAIVWMDAIHFKVREDGRVITKAVYSVLGVNMHGQKEVLGLYLGHHESAAFWMQVLSDLNQRGVEDILITCIDNLKGFSEAIESVYPHTHVQLCVVHQIRNSIKYLSNKDKKAFLDDLKKVYKASSLELAESHLDELEARWKHKYPIVIKSWRSNWPRLCHYFEYPAPVRNLIYTTNIVEGYHRMIRKVTKNKGAFTSDMAVLKQVYLVTMNCHKQWVRPVKAWPTLFNQLSLYFKERILDADTLY